MFFALTEEAALAALLLGAVLSRSRHPALRIPAYALALVLPALLLVTDLTLRPIQVTRGLPTAVLAHTSLSFGPGWWLLHAAALVPIAALARADLHRGSTGEPDLSAPAH